jgi:hypothetical protein
VKPRQFRNQLAYRIINEDNVLPPQVLSAFGINPNMGAEGAAPDYPCLEAGDDNDIYHGVVEFEVQVGVLGRSHTIDCRAVYAATLTNDGSLDALMGGGVLDEREIVLQRLEWQPGNPTRARWAPFEPGPLFSDEIWTLLDVLIEKDAIAQSEAA